jgi:DNA/RNA-binding domain of Phe-tRNA-synthetase-like protein
LKKSEVIDAALKKLLSEQRQQFDRYQAVTREHIEIWQKLLKQCGMSPQMQ